MYDVINSVQPGLYTKQSTPKEVRKEMFDATNMKPGLYTKVSKSHEVRKAAFDKIAPAYNQLKRAMKVIKSINNKPLKGEKWIARNAKSGERRIEFNIESLNDENKEYFHTHISDVFITLMNKMTMNQNWICGYTFNNNQSHAILNEIKAGDLIHQMKSENYISEAEAENCKIQERDYDFFQTEIKNLTQITFYDISEYPNLEMSDIRKGKIENKDEFADDAVYQALVSSGATEEVINQYKATKRKASNKKKQYKTQDGKFWKYTCNIPINLER
jgi:hypothetical protein